MADIRVEQSNEEVVLTLSGELTTQHAGEIRGSLLHALQSAGRVAVSMENIVDVDVSFLQLLCAAHRSAMTLNKQMTVDGGAHEAFRQAAGRGGFWRHIGCPEDIRKACLWLS